MNTIFGKFKTKKERVNKINEKLLEDGEEFQDYVKYILKTDGYFVDYYKSEIFQRLVGEGPSEFEIKTDNRCTGFNNTKSTNRLSIEYAKYYKFRRDDQYRWVKSGILSHTNPLYYVQGNPDNFWIFKTCTLKELLLLKKSLSYYFERKEYYPSKQWSGCKKIVNDVNEYPLKSFLLPIEQANDLCIARYIINDKITVIKNDDTEGLLKIKKSISDIEESYKSLF